MGNLKNAVWLYMSSEVRTEEEAAQFIEWCSRNNVGKVLVQINSGEQDERITKLVERCAQAGIEVHGMLSTLLKVTTHRQKLQLQDRDCYCIDYHGISNWDEPLGGKGYLLDPTSETVKLMVADMCCRILSNYPKIAGIHLDFIRYFHYDSRLKINTKDAGHFILTLAEGSPIRMELANGAKVTYFVEKVKNAYIDPPIGEEAVLRRNCYFCFCDRCLTQFQEACGITIPSSLSSTHEKAKWIMSNCREGWDKFHANTITGLVRQIRNALKMQKEDSQLSAAVWYNSPYGNELRGEPLTPYSEYTGFGQEWWSWAQDGLIDFLCPMDYWLSPENYQKVVLNQMERIKGKIPVFYGLLSTTEYNISRQQFDKYAEALKAINAHGICFFHYGTWKNIL